MKTKKAQLFTETTEVPAERSIQEIYALLIRVGACAINTNFEAGKLQSVSFVLPYGTGRIPYLLPARIEPVFKKLNGRREHWGAYSRNNMAQKDREQAERIAWRQLYWWLKSQLALIDLGMVESAEVLMPYMLGTDGRSFFDTYRQKMIEAPDPAKGTA